MRMHTRNRTYSSFGLDYIDTIKFLYNQILTLSVGTECGLLQEALRFSAWS